MYESFMKLLKDRRTIRKFLPDELPEGHVEKIIEAARLAPSGFNSQPWETVVVKDPSVKDQVTRILQGKEDVSAISRKGFAAAPVYIFFFGDTRLRSWAPGPVKKDEETWNYIFNASLAAGFEHMHLAAASLGLGAMWVTASRMNGASEKVKTLLELPDYLYLFEMLALGYPNQTPVKKKLRSLDSMIHYDTCGASGFRSVEALERYFGKKMNPSDSDPVEKNER
jgi:nitroreductase